MTRLTKTEIDNRIDLDITDNDNNEITGPVLNSVPKVLNENLYVTINDSGDIITIPEWNNTTDYSAGFGIYDGNTYNAVQPSGPNEGGAVEPGTDATVWKLVETDQLAHPQNSDARLGRNIGLIDATVAGGLTGTVDLTTSEFKNLNYFILNTDAGSNDATYTLQSKNGSAVKTGMILLVVPESATYTITFPENSEQKTGNIELTGGDIAFFECNVYGKTKLIASNKMSVDVSNFDTQDEISLNIEPDILEEGTGISVTAAATEIDISQPTREGDVTVTGDSTTVTLGLSPGTYTTDELAGTYIEIDYSVFSGEGKELYEITANTDTGTLTLAIGVSFSLADAPYRLLPKIYTLPTEFEEKVIVLTYNNNDDYARPLKTWLTAGTITTGGVLTIEATPEILVTDNNVDYQIHETQEIDVSDKDNVVACLTSEDIVLTIPSIASEPDRTRLTIYREGGNDAGSDNLVYIFLTENVLGTDFITLDNDGELVELASHLYGGAHIDLFRRSGLCVCLNVAIETADTTGLTNTSYQTIQPTSWDLNHPSRFQVEVQVDGSVVMTYTSRIKRNLLVSTSMEAVRTGGTPQVDVAAEIDSGSGWTLWKKQTIDMSNNSPSSARTLLVSRLFSFGDKLRFVSKSDGDGYYISSLNCVTANSNA